MLPIIIAFGVGVGLMALYEYLTGNDPVTSAAETAVESTLGPIGTALGNLINALTLPITIPAHYLANALFRLGNLGGPLAVLIAILTYYYVLITLLLKRNLDSKVLKTFIRGELIVILVYRIYRYVTMFR